jgi:hypothetical protein
MKKLLGTLFLLLAFALPTLAQQRLSPDDQRRFDSYYSRWQDYQQRSNVSEMQSMQKRMLDIYGHYGIPPQTPFWRVASNARGEHDRWRGRLNPNDQSRWQQYRQTNDRGQIDSMEKRMRDIYAQYRIPPNTPYWWVASNAGDRDHW